MLPTHLIRLYVVPRQAPHPIFREAGSRTGRKDLST